MKENYTKEQAMDRAKKLGLQIYTQKAYTKQGRRVFLVTSASATEKKHCVSHTASGLVCDCKSFEYNGMCSCIGCVLNLLHSLTVKERTALLSPRKEPVKVAPKQEAPKAEPVKQEVKREAPKKEKPVRVKTTTIGAEIEANLPFICMRGGR